MNLKRLNHLVALADERNFARAAERVHLSQPALSRSIQAAEAELGFALFDRGPAEVTPTPAGAFVIERARKLLFDSRCMERDIDLYRKKLIGDISVGVGPFPASTMLPELVPELRKSFPGVRIRIEVNNWVHLVQHLRDEELDFFVADIRDIPAGPDLDITLLARQHGGFYARPGHSLLVHASLQPADMIPFGIATVRLPNAIRGALAQLLGLQAGVPLPIALECDDVQLLKRTVQHSDTILAVAHAAVRQEADAGQLALLPFKNLPPLHSEMGVVSLRGRSHSPVAEEMIERLKAVALQLSVEVDKQLSAAGTSVRRVRRRQ
jgi:DNA-binding transcriptional LysR family regulator